VDRYSFGVGLLHPLLHAGLSRRTYATLPHLDGIFRDGGNMALYYLVLRLVVDVSGPNVAVERLPSLVCGTATIPVVFLLGRRLVGQRTGTVAAAVFAVSLPLTFWEQTARAYAMAMFFVSVSMLAFCGWSTRPRVGTAGSTSCPRSPLSTRAS
jgi:hypothetical protein